MFQFLKENYYDFEFNKYVYWRPNDLMTITPFGLYYLDFISSSNDSSYMLGLVDEDNNKVGYISTIETNFFFRNKGILNIALDEIEKLFKDNEILIVSPESINGEKVGVFKKISDKFLGKVKVIDEDEYVDSLKKRNRW